MPTRLAEIGHAAVTGIERQHWLAPIEDGIQRAVTRAFTFAGRAVRNALHGTWLGHPLHPALTDVTLGAWIGAVYLDALDGRKRRYARAADASLALGIGSAVATAASGLADWQHTQGGSRRTGLVHAVLNTGALGLFIGSFVSRRRGERDAGRALAATGLFVALGAAYLGGSLVYRYRLGVDRSRSTEDDTRDSIEVPTLGEGERRRIEVNGVPLVLIREGGRVYAIGARCSHMGGPLADGRIEAGAIVCPWHGSRFCLEDGRVLDGPATIAAPCYEVREIGERLMVRRAA